MNWIPLTTIGVTLAAEVSKIEVFFADNLGSFDGQSIAFGRILIYKVECTEEQRLWLLECLKLDLHLLRKRKEKLIHTYRSNLFPRKWITLTNSIGFIKKRQKMLSLLQKKIHKALSEKQTCVPLLLDFSKAFDIVSKNIILNIIDRLAITSSSQIWFKLYLSDRSK